MPARLSAAAPILLTSTLLAALLACGGSTPGGGGRGLRSDQTTLAVESIPLTGLDQGRALRMHLRHASVGDNVWSGLTTLAGSNAARYAIPSWSEANRGNPGWLAKLDDFSTYVAAQAGNFDVFQMKFCFIDQDASFTAYRDRMLSLEASYPTKRFVWWTMPIMTSGSDNALRAAFNDQVRAFAAASGKPLFDIAAIESHHADGSAVTSGGVEAMAPEWSSDGGHLNADGSARAAQGMWWLMARLGGWSGS